jgi:hypothetical protein
MNQLRMIKQTIYALNREYGRPIVIVRPTVTKRDFKDGCLETETNKIKVRRAIVLPSNGLRDFDYDLSFIAANKNFTYGALFQKTFRNIIIEIKRVPKDFVIDHETHVEFDGKRWEIKKFHKVEETKAWEMVVQETQSEAPLP